MRGRAYRREKFASEAIIYRCPDISVSVHKRGSFGDDCELVFRSPLQTGHRSSKMFLLATGTWLDRAARAARCGPSVCAERSGGFPFVAGVGRCVLTVAIARQLTVARLGRHPMGPPKAWKEEQYAAHRATTRAAYGTLPAAALLDKAVALDEEVLRARHQGALAHRQETQSACQTERRMLSGERNGIKVGGSTTPFLQTSCSDVVKAIRVNFLKLTALGNGHRQRSRVLNEFFACVWGGTLLQTLQLRTLQSARIDPRRLVELTTLHPRALNFQGVKGMCNAPCPDSGRETRRDACRRTRNGHLERVLQP